MMTLPASMDPSKPSGSNGLLGVVRINEEVKKVVDVAFKIDFMALNAILLAKRAGKSALGFGVLSNQFRTFSQDLRNSMQALNGLTYACVNEVSRVLQDERHTRLLREAARQAPGAWLDKVIERRVRGNEEEAARLSTLRHQLRRSLEAAFRLVRLGGVLAKSAKIEAAYGQGHAAALAQVSGEFDGVVEEIHRSLEALCKSPFFAEN